jgi:NifU-like protein involved in Fe-S cluster formation
MPGFPGNPARNISGTLLHLRSGFAPARNRVDQAIIKYYRQLLKTDFENAGSIENAAIFLEAVGERMIHCGNTGNYMQLFLHIADNRVEDIKYRCSCEPTANVAVEVLCTLVKSKALEEAATVSEQAFYQLVGSQDEELQIKVRGLLEMLKKGILGYQDQHATTHIQWLPD